MISLARYGKATGAKGSELHSRRCNDHMTEAEASHSLVKGYSLLWNEGIWFVTTPNASNA